MVNKVILVGNLGKAPDVAFTPNGKAVCKFSLATSEKWTDANGQKQERTEWANVVVWGAQAEACGKYLDKGRQVYVEGRLTTRSYEQDGQKKYITEVVARDVRFLGGGQQGKPRHDEAGAPPDEGGSDIPF